MTDVIPGTIPELDLARVLVISPHLDDAVLSCAHLCTAAAEALVVTVFAGVPSRYAAAVSAWDSSCGFEPGDDVVAKRREEDLAALQALGAAERYFDYLDVQYRTGNEYGHDGRDYTVDEIADRLRAVIAEWNPTTIAFPLALGHPDHVLACSAALSIEASHDGRAWLGYAEFPYVWQLPDAAARRIGQVRRKGYALTPVLSLVGSPERKAAALAGYRSQLEGLGIADDVERVARAPEQLWLIGDRRSLAERVQTRAAYEFKKRRAAMEARRSTG
jgi:LmbE family N-acetylglucosaminyl deacetylase